MVTRLSPVNISRVNFYDGQQVNEEDMTDEQTRNVGIDAATENNFFGSGVIEEFPTPPVIFDSSDLNSQQQSLIDAYSFDGSNVAEDSPAVSDTTNGVQLSVKLTDVDLDGSAITYISIIGDEFGDNLIHDDLVFYANGTQVTRGRYKNIRSIIFSNFAGNLNGSTAFALDDGYAFTGSCTILEAKAMEISEDPMVAAQVAQPSQFFKEFYPGSSSDTITSMLQSAIGSDKSISDLDIGTASVTKRELIPNNVTTRIGQKFQAQGNNIQKISVLLSVKYDAASAIIPGNDGYEWSGSIVLTLHELQTDVQCPVSPVPDTAIDFDPDPTVFAQLTLNASDMAKQGIDLDGYERIVDFTFTGSNIASSTNSNIEEDNYYILTIGRSGNADIGTILIEEASDRLDNSHMSVYDGTRWIDILDSDMWFVVYGDYVKAADGIAYDNGVGVQVPRIAKDSTNTEVPYVEGFLPFYTTVRDGYNYVLLDVQDVYSEPEQDQRTGNPIQSRVTSDPLITLESASSRTSLLALNPDTVFLAGVRDQNPRGNPSEITGTNSFVGLAYANRFNIINPDADLIQHNLVGSILNPVSNGCSDCSFRIIKQTYYDDAYGDINGDGVVTAADAQIVNDWISSYTSIDSSDPTDQLLFTTGVIDIRQFLRADVNGDGVVDQTDATAIEEFIAKTISIFTDDTGGDNVTFPRMELIVEDILNPLDAVADIPGSCCNAFDSPFTSVPWSVEFYATWHPDFIAIEDLRRLLPRTISGDWFINQDLILGGFMYNPDGTPYSIDFEINHLSLDLPITDSYGNPTFMDGYTGILLFETFIAETALGMTSYGFPAMKYADGTYVQIGDFPTNVKISVSIQSIATEHDVPLGGTIKESIGLYYDPATSLMTLYLADLYNDHLLSEVASVSTKILMVMYIKKAGFANTTSAISKSQMRSLLEI